MGQRKIITVLKRAHEIGGESTIYLNKYSHTAFTYTDLAIQKLLSSVLIFVHKSLLCLKFTENCLPTK